MRLSLLFCLLACWTAGVSHAASSSAWHRVVGLLEYLEADYPGALATGDPAEMEEQRAFIAEALEAVQALGPAAQTFAPRIEAVKARIDAGQDPEGVPKDLNAIVRDLVLAGGLSRSPRKVPNVERGKALYATACAACHGEAGDGKGRAAPGLEPPPASFHDAERMDGLTPYKAYNTLTFGITGTAMPAYASLDEDDRWALAFFLFTFRQPPCDDGKAPPSGVETLATSTDATLREKHSAREVACLRRHPPEVDQERSLIAAREGVERALELSKAGQPVEAKRAVLDAYLNGLEPVEARLRAKHPGLVLELEGAFNRTRVAVEAQSPRAADEGRALLLLIDQARKVGSEKTDFWAVFWVALAILLREGFEATIIIAALLAVLKKLGQTERARVVHLGWGSALVAGAALYFVFRGALSGAGREWLEGLVGLVAVATLLYAALWLNARANMSKFMGELRGRMQGALGQGSSVGLFVVAFSAMFRESLETAIFLQGLSIDSPSGVMWGALAGLVVLLALVLVVRRVGYRLPMKALFTGSTVLLVATAVVLLGKSLRALQETGFLPLKPIPFVHVELLGVYPDALTLLPQLLLIAAPIAWWLIKRRGGGTVVPSSTSTNA